MVYKRPSRAGQEGVSGERGPGMSSYTLQSKLLAKTTKENIALKKANADHQEAFTETNRDRKLGGFVWISLIWGCSGGES